MGWVCGRRAATGVVFVQEDGVTALMVACLEGVTDIVRMLLTVPGLNVNAAKVPLSSELCVGPGKTPACCYSPLLRSLRARGVVGRLPGGAGSR
jgi:hypothetical protein